MDNQWLVNIIDMPLPELLNETEDQSRLVSLWSEYFPPNARDGEGDFEDFFEQAVRLDSAISSFGLPNINLINNWGSGECKNLGTGVVHPVTSLKMLPRYGAQEKSVAFVDSKNHSIRSESNADRYHNSKSFIENAGRKTVLTGMNAEDQNIFQDVVDMSAQGIDRLFIKTTAAKRGVWKVDLPENLSYDQAYKLIMHEIDWTLIRYEGIRNAFFVQEYINMNYEYRLFVVDGEVVTGSGCIEEHTPLDNIDTAFNPLVRKNRAEVSPVENRSDIVEKLVEFGSSIARSMSDEDRTLVGYVIDVALDDKGEPLVIERNSLLNAGLYANKNVLVTDALKEFDFAKLPA